VIYAYLYSPKHVSKDCPNLLKKWEDKKGPTVTWFMPSHARTMKKNEEADIWVVTLQRGKT
jgi:hypothetical protein